MWFVDGVERSSDVVGTPCRRKSDPALLGPFGPLGDHADRTSLFSPGGDIRHLQNEFVARCPEAQPDPPTPVCIWTVGALNLKDAPGTRDRLALHHVGAVKTIGKISTAGAQRNAPPVGLVLVTPGIVDNIALDANGALTSSRTVAQRVEPKLAASSPFCPVQPRSACAQHTRIGRHLRLPTWMTTSELRRRPLRAQRDSRVWQTGSADCPALEEQSAIAGWSLDRDPYLSRPSP